MSASVISAACQMLARAAHKRAESALARHPRIATVKVVQLNNVASIAASGMRFQTQRLAQSAANVANINTDGYEAETVSGVAAAGGGVTAESYPTYAPHTLQMQDDGSTRSASNTDLASETVTQMTSLRGFQANLAVLRTSDEMLGSLLDRLA
ncbi:MAG TPA: flagellar basal body rod C-terminal domain-containing protein [Polyangiales bacterium]|jgi:flagellar basal-body rod protein FlgC